MRAVKVGETFGRLTVISETECVPRRRRNGVKNGYKYFCTVRCECGTEKRVEVRRLIDGNTRSCGCLKYENHNRMTHGAFMKHREGAGASG